MIRIIIWLLYSNAGEVLIYWTKYKIAPCDSAMPLEALYSIETKSIVSLMAVAEAQEAILYFLFYV